MTNQINGDKLFVIDLHPAIPPADQLKKWEDKWFDEGEHPDVLLIQAFQAGADQELEACIEWLGQNQGRWEIPMALRDARRPKPPSLKEQALTDLSEIGSHYIGPGAAKLIDTIRRALEALPE
jgi:hypothetical protein